MQPAEGRAAGTVSTLISLHELEVMKRRCHGDAPQLLLMHTRTHTCMSVMQFS